MKIDAKVDVLGLVEQTTKSQKNLVFSVEQGLNRTAAMIQAEQQEAVKKQFLIRSQKTRDFLVRRVAVHKPRASVREGRLWTEVAVNAQARNLLLADFEDGGERKPFKGKDSVAVPLTGGARQMKSDPVADRFLFRNMKLKAKKTAQGKKVYTGAGGFFQTAKGVFQRSGTAVKMLWAFARGVKIPKKLGWRKRSQDVANKWLSENITQAFLKSGKRKP